MADPQYPCVTLTVNYGELLSANYLVQAMGGISTGLPEGAEFDPVIANMKAYLEGVPGVTGVVGTKLDAPVSTPL